jgi:hypothetical protein
MYQGHIEPPKVKVAQRGGPCIACRNAGIALVLVILVFGFSLLFWPFPPLVRAQIGADASGVQRYLEQVDRALQAGEPIPNAMLREGQLNAFVRQASPLKDRSMSVYMTAGKLVLVADEQTGSFQISTRLVLETDPDSGRVMPRSLWVGHLPLPRFMAAGWSRSLARRFKIEVNPQLWDAMGILRIDANAVAVGEAGPPAS